MPNPLFPISLQSRAQIDPAALEALKRGEIPATIAKSPNFWQRMWGNNADDLNMAYALSTAQGRQETSNAMQKMTKESELGTKRLALTAMLEALRDASLNAYREGNLKLGAQLESQRDQAMNALQQGNMILADKLATGRDVQQTALGMLRDSAQNTQLQSNMRLGSKLRIKENDDQLGTTGAERRLLAAPILQRQVRMANAYNSLLDEHPELADALLEEEMTGKAWKNAGSGGGLYNTVTGRSIEGSHVLRTPVFDTTDVGGVKTSKVAGMQDTYRPGAIEAPYFPTLRQKKDGSPQGLSPADQNPYNGPGLEELLRGMPGTPLQPESLLRPSPRVRQPFDFSY